MRPDQQNGHDRAVRHLHHPDTAGCTSRRAGRAEPWSVSGSRTTLRSTLTLVVVAPTLDLIAQTALARRKDGRTEAMVAVCSVDTC